jgi:agmatinase
MRRMLDENPGPLVALGIRSFSLEDADFLQESSGGIEVWSAERIYEEEPRIFIRKLKKTIAGRRLYVTIDVDGMDPSVVPATGTPEPGGLSWLLARDILRAVAEAGEVAAIDCVELAPRPGLHMAEFAVARLLADFLNRILAPRAPASA